MVVVQESQPAGPSLEGRNGIEAGELNKTESSGKAQLREDSDRGTECKPSFSLYDIL